MPNHQQATCDADRIEAFLNQRLSLDEQSDFESHLDECRRCRDRLESSAAHAELWTEVRESLSVELSEPATGDQAAFSHQTVLNWLAPSDDDRMLGRLGTYEIVGVVGSGGMGVVLKAFDPALNRYVAIKVLAPHLASSGAARRRFSREAQASAAVVHENVIEIHGVADKDGLPYLVMPYVSGPSLQRRLNDEGPLETTEILRIGLQAAKGLAAAHSQGLVHRDVKPANILLEQGVERVKLTDFGLARAADDASLTKSGVIAGTPQYMSPEQARGESVDQRSDLFSLGSVLYAMCTGRSPFRAETSYGVLRRITDDEPKPIREVNPEISEWLCRLIGRLMSKDMDSRLQSAQEVAELLETCLAHVQQPTVVPLPESLVTQPKPKRFFGIKTAIAALSIGLLAFLEWQVTSPPDISGSWTGDGWGQVTLERTGRGKYSGTYTDTFGPDKGTINLKWSKVDQRYRGTWGEAQRRIGKISVELDEGKIRGFWTASNKSEIKPGSPEVEQLVWVRGTKAGPSDIVHLNLKSVAEDFRQLIEQRQYEKAASLARIAQERASDQETQQTWEVWSKFARQLEQTQANSAEEQELRELLGFPTIKVKDPFQPHAVAPPTETEILRVLESRLKLTEGKLTGLFQKHPDDLRIVIEQVYDKLDPPRVFPLIGTAILHRVRFQCTVYFTDTNEVTWPVSHDDDKQFQESLNIDHDHLHVVERVVDSLGDSPSAEPVPITDTTLQVLGPNGRPVADNAVIRGSEGYTGRELPSQSETPSDHGVISLSKLQPGTHWLLVNWSSILRLQLPAAEQKIVRTVPQAGPKRFSLDVKNLDVQTSVEATDDGDIIVVRIHNRDKQAIQISEANLELLPSIKGRGADARVFSPLWKSAADGKTLPVTTIEPGEKATLRINWTDWVRHGYWFSRDGEVITEPAFPDNEPGKAWVRVIPGSGRSISVTHPDLLVADNQEIKNPTQEKPLTLSFLNAPYAEVIKLLAKTLNVPAQFDAEPSGTFSAERSQPLPVSRVLKIINYDLAKQGLTIVREPGRLLVRAVKPEDAISKQLQGEWEYLSFERDGVVKQYKPGTTTLSISGDRWTMGPVAESGLSHRVEVEENRLTFHGKTSTGPFSGAGGNEPSLAYGLFELKGDALVYSLSSFSPEDYHLEGKSPSYPRDFETKGTDYTLFRLRRIKRESRTPSPNSGTSSQSSSTPQTRRPDTPAEKAIARLVLVFFQDRARRAIPGILVDAGDRTLVIAAAPATIVPDGTPHAVDRMFLEFPESPAIEASFLTGTKEFSVYQVDRKLADAYLPESALELKTGDRLSAILPESTREFRIHPDYVQIVSMNAKASLDLKDRDIHHDYDQLIEINRSIPEGTPLYQGGKLAGLTLLGTRFLGETADKSYVVPVSRLAEFGETIGKALLESDPLSPLPEVLSAKQVVERGEELSLRRTKVRVRFQVGGVKTIKVTDVDGNTREQWELLDHNDSGWTIRITPAAQAALAKNGIEDIPRHFKGKTLEMIGEVHAVGLNLITRPDTLWTYHTVLDSLDQYRVLSDDDTAGQDPAEQPAAPPGT